MMHVSGYSIFNTDTIRDTGCMEYVSTANQATSSFKRVSNVSMRTTSRWNSNSTSLLSEG